MIIIIMVAVARRRDTHDDDEKVGPVVLIIKDDKGNTSKCIADIVSVSSIFPRSYNITFVYLQSYS